MALDQVNIDDYDVSEDGQIKLSPEKDMSFLDHLEELRWHIVRSLTAVIIFAVGVFFMKNSVFDGLILGPKSENFISYKLLCHFSHLVGAGESACVKPVVFDVIAIEMGELFLTHLKVSIILGIVVSFPYIFWEFWRFVRPGLYPKEQKAVRGIVFYCSFLFFSGIAFGYLIISPFAVNFLAGYQISGVVPQVRIASIVNYMVMFTLPTGIIFELPIVVYFLAKVGLITASFMREYRRHAFIIILIVAAIITPPDVITQLLITAPLYFLYEVSILIAARMEKKYEENALVLKD
jgi:sec-independent protein translocase protein TatC